MKLSIIVPVYNESSTILEILKRVQQADIGPDWQKQIIVVDNCSTDGTRDLLLCACFIFSCISSEEFFIICPDRTVWGYSYYEVQNMFMS